MNVYVRVFVWTCAFISLAVSLGEALLGHMVIPPVFSFEGLPDCFPKQPHRFTFTPAVCEGSNFSPSQLMLSSIFLIRDILVGMKWYLRVVFFLIEI